MKSCALSDYSSALIGFDRTLSLCSVKYVVVADARTRAVGQHPRAK